MENSNIRIKHYLCCYETPNTGPTFFTIEDFERNKQFLSKRDYIEYDPFSKETISIIKEAKEQLKNMETNNIERYGINGCNNLKLLYNILKDQGLTENEVIFRRGKFHF